MVTTMHSQIEPAVVPVVPVAPVDPPSIPDQLDWTTVTPEILLSLWKQHDLQPERGHWQVQNQRTCALGILYYHVVGDRAGRNSFESLDAPTQEDWLRRFPEHFNAGLTKGFDTHRASSLGKDEWWPHFDSAANACGFNLGKQTIDLLIERGLI